MTTKEQLKTLCASIIDMAEEQINNHLSDERNQTQAEINGAIVVKLGCDSELSRIIVKSYIDMRPEIESVKGRHGGVRRILQKTVAAPQSTVELAKEETNDALIPLDFIKLNTNDALPISKVEVQLSADTKELPYNLTAKAHKEAKETREQKEKELGIERKDTITSDIA